MDRKVVVVVLFEVVAVVSSPTTSWLLDVACCAV